MILSFSKRIIDHGWYDGRKIIAQTYEVSKGKDVIGKYVCSFRDCYITHGEEKIEIIREWKNIFKALTFLRKAGTQEIIGEYKFSYWSNGHHRLFLGEKVFLFGKCPPDISFSLFKLSTWNHYKFSLSGGGGVFYYLFRASSSADPFDGTIECEGVDLPALLAGIYFIDAYLEELGRG